MPANSAPAANDRTAALLRLEAAGQLPAEHAAAIGRLRSAGEFPDPLSSSSTTRTPTSDTARPGNEPLSTFDASDAPPAIGGIGGGKVGQLAARSLSGAPTMLPAAYQPGPSGQFGRMVGGEAAPGAANLVRQLVRSNPRLGTALAIGLPIALAALGRAGGEMATIGAQTASPDRSATNDAAIESAGQHGALGGLAAEGGAQVLGRADDALRLATQVAKRQGGITGFVGTILDALLRGSDTILNPETLRGPLNATISAVDRPSTRRLSRTTTPTTPRRLTASR